jgi:PKD repeat protein
VHQYEQEGQYLVKLKAIDQNTCIGIDSVSKLVTIYRNDVLVQDDDVLCHGDSYKLTATGAVSYYWEEEGGDFTSISENPVVMPEDTTSNHVTTIDADGCDKVDTVQLDVVPPIDVIMKFELLTDCWSRPSVQVRNISPSFGLKEYYFDFGDGVTSEEERVIHSYANDGDYDVRLVTMNEFCVFEDLRTVPIYELKVPNIVTPDGTKGHNDYFVIQFGDEGRAPADSNLKVKLKVFDRWGKKVFEDDDYQNDWNASNVESGVYYYEATLKEYTVCKGWVHIVK